MQRKATYKVVTRRISTDALDKIDDLESKIKSIKKSKGDRSPVFVQEITSDCILLGAPLLEEKLNKFDKQK